MFAVATPSIDRTFCLLIVSPPFPTICFLLERRRVSLSGNDRYLGCLGLADFPIFRVFLQFELVFSELCRFLGLLKDGKPY